MPTIATLEELARIVVLPPAVLRGLLTGSTPLALVQHAFRPLSEARNDADVCVLKVSDTEKWIVNVRDLGGTAPPERHRDWHDLSRYVLGGNDITVDGTLEGATETSDGEWREGTIAGGRTLAVRPGDLLWTPAGTPHQSHFLPGTAFIIVKIRKGSASTLLHELHIPDLTSPLHRARAVAPTPDRMAA